jgi:hypothetical protein
VIIRVLEMFGFEGEYPSATEAMGATPGTESPSTLYAPSHDPTKP